MKDKKIVISVVAVILLLFIILGIVVAVALNKDKTEKKKDNKKTDSIEEKYPYKDTGPDDTGKPLSLEEQIQNAVGENVVIEKYEQQADGTYYVYGKSKQNTSSGKGYYIVNLNTGETVYRVTSHMGH